MIHDIPAWALQAADDFEGEAEVNLDLAALIAKRLDQSIMDKPPAARDTIIEQMIAREVC